MKSRRYSLSHAATRPRSTIQTVTAVTLIVFTMLLMFMHHRDNSIITSVRSTMQDALTPVIMLLSKPAHALDALGQRFEDVSRLYAENNMLKADNAQLLQWQNVAKQLEHENGELRGLLGLPAPAHSRYVSAHIVGREIDLKSRSLLISHNQPDQLQAGYAVITAKGLLGRIIETSKSTAQVLLVTDHQSRLAVKNESNNQAAILSGSSKGALHLKFAANGDSFAVGDRIITGDTNTHFPSNIVIGEVSAKKNGMITVLPYANARDASFVSIIIPPDAQTRQRK